MGEEVEMKIAAFFLRKQKKTVRLTKSSKQCSRNKVSFLTFRKWQKKGSRSLKTENRLNVIMI